ncbi:glycosyltransferase [Microbacterium hominis]|uniref:Glycosyltransferase family 1 protein n=1 Tax=Microbacterium hominis TaxID=162426 RepID=A0A7D4UBV7_9MICO|nr:glycosyltransferase [Microbacterium hominis]QKJ20023.1 glycosyltransferase family 1 protein [Microbacterium hominis]
MTSRPTMLILSYSPIARDARVLKQVARFTRDFDVTTCGYGPAPEGVVEHISIPDDQRYNDLDGKLITLKRYRTAYWRLSAVKWSRQALRGRRFDVAIANDVEAVPVAVKLRPRHGVLADLHEYSPRLHDDNALWFQRITPWFEWVVARYVTRADAWTTVSRGIVDEYEKNFGFRAELVTNAAPFSEAAPSDVSAPIRLVHSGACLRNRRLHVMAEAVEAAAADVTLDFYLTPNDPPYLEELKEFAAASSRVTVHDPVPYAQLAATLPAYDVGIHVLPPINFNNKLALPNKLFDYIQARLGVLIGPSEEMAFYVETYDVGEIADDFTVEATTAALDRLTVESVARFKSNADRHAEELAGERQVEVWEAIITRLMAKRKR